MPAIIKEFEEIEIRVVKESIYPENFNGIFLKINAVFNKLKEKINIMNSKILKIKKGMVILTVALVMFFNNQNLFVYAQTAPQPPSAPTAPDAPPPPDSAPEAPEAPEAPSSPSDSDSELAVTVDNYEKDQEHHNHDEEEETYSGSEEQNLVSNTSSPVTESSGGESGSGVVGDTEIKTGDATNDAGITTAANSNLSASVPKQLSSSGVSVANKDNGSGSQNTGSVNLSNEDVTNQVNGASVGNNLWQKTETGDNDASRNVGSSYIETGDANTTGTMITSVNTNIDGVAVNEFNIADDHLGDIILDFGSCVYNCVPGDITSENSGNGSDSENTSDITSNIDSYTFQTNEASVENNMTLKADSGDNSTDRNTGGDSEIITGDANVSANSLTFANNNISGNVIYSVVNIFGELIGDIIMPEGFCCFDSVALANTGNGSESENLADVSLSDSDLITQFNNADIQNNIILYANTGENETSDNTGGASSVKTGSANAELQLVNVANTNIIGGDWWMVIVNEAGNWFGKILGAPLGSLYGGSEGFLFSVDDAGAISVTNSDNGSSSQNTGSVSQENSNTLIQKNDAKIVNNFDLSANTGANSASRNTGGDSSITTGDANIIANLVNFVNNNIVGSGKLFVTVVNVFGSWIGDFVGPGQTKQTNNSQESGIGGEENSSNGSSSSDNSNANQQTSQSTNSTKPPASQVLGLFINNNYESSSSTEGEEESEDSALVAASGDDGSGAAGDKVVNVNLAWLTLLLPFLLLYIIRRKRLSLKSVTVKPVPGVASN